MHPDVRMERRLMRIGTYAPDWRRPRVRWTVIKRRRVGVCLRLLCERRGDFAVFDDCLEPCSYPSDKFYGSSVDAHWAYWEEP